MKHGSVLTAGCALFMTAVVGCSTPDSDAPEETVQPDQATVTFGGSNAGAPTAINCATGDGRTTITIAADQKTTIVLTDAPAPVLKSVGIGEIGSAGPSLAYAEGVSGEPAVVTRDGQRYTISGSGMGTDPGNPLVPVPMPFEIAVTCP